MTPQNRTKTRWAKAAAITLIIGGVVVPVASVSGANSQPRDNDANSIIWGGAYTKTEWVNKVRANNDGHGHHDLQQIYYHEGRGITEANFLSADTVDGTVYKDGHVTVANKVAVNGRTVFNAGATVGTSMVSVGRHKMAGSTKSGSVWQTPNQQAFVGNSIPAWINMSGGTLHYVIIKSCANSGSAKPVQPPKPSPSPSPSHTPTPKPSPSHTPTPSPSPSPSPSPTPTPTPTPSPSPSPSPSHTPTPSPSPSVTPTPSATPSPTVTPSPSPSTSPSPLPIVSPSPSTPPGQVLGVTLPDTGPEAALGGLAGLSAIGVASRAYVRSRKSLLGSLRGQNRQR